MPRDLKIEERRPKLEIDRRRRRGIYEDPLQHLWAISYSDLLMVVMTFFIFYFSFSDKVSSSTLLQLVAQLNHQDVTQPPGGDAPRATASHNPLPDLGKEIVAAEQDVGLTTETVNDRLLIHFPDDFYAPGQYRMGETQQAAFTRLLAVLAPYHDRLNATLIGHADKIPVGRPIESIINSNLVLSTLRAARAAEFLLLKGWEPDRVFAKGNGEYVRATRSLSIQLEERK